MAEKHCTEFFSVEEEEEVTLVLEDGTELDVEVTGVEEDSGTYPNHTYRMRMMWFVDRDGVEYVGGVEGVPVGMGYPPLKKGGEDGEPLGYVVEVKR